MDDGYVKDRDILINGLDCADAIQKPKTGHQCSECGFIFKFMYDKCPNCGCRMVEPQERSDKE